MHVAFLTTEYPPLPSGGIGTSIRNLSKALVAQGHRVTVLGIGEQPAEFEDQGVRVRFLNYTAVPKVGVFLDSWLIQKELKRLVREEGVDVIEANDWGGPSAGLRPDCPVVVRCNGSATYFAHLLRGRVRTSTRWAERLALRGADRVIAVSQFTAGVTGALFDLTEPVDVIPNGIDVGQFRPANPAEVRPETILYLGTLVRKKGVLDLPHIFSLVAERHREARLWLVGRDSGDDRTGSPSTWELFQKALSPQARERVEYFGAQPYAKVQEFVRRAGVCVFPSYAEALPLSWLEAMACAKPVVAYNFGWAPEVIESGVSGRLVPLGEKEEFAKAIREMLENPDEGRRLGVAARRRAESLFASGAVARRSVRCYQEVLGSRT